MFKSKLLLLTVIASVTFVSCQKENLTGNIQAPSDALVKTKTDGNSVETYYYDNQKRLSKIVFTSATTPSYYHEFTYTDGLVAEYKSEEPRYDLEQTLPNGVTKINCTSNPALYKLNNNGFYSGNTSICQSQGFKYDSNGFIIEKEYSITDYSSNEVVINDSKNITRISGKAFSYGGGELDLTTTYNYFSDKVNTIGNKNFGKLYLGKSSENILKSETKDNKTINYSYVFDEQQRVIQKTTNNGNIETSVSYTYY